MSKNLWLLSSKLTPTCPMKDFLSFLELFEALLGKNKIEQKIIDCRSENKFFQSQRNVLDGFSETSGNKNFYSDLPESF